MDHFLWSGSADKTIRVWNIKDGSNLKVLKAHTSAINSIQGIGQTLYSASEDGTVRTWDFANMHTILSKEEKKELLKETKQLGGKEDAYSEQWYCGHMSRQESENLLTNRDYKVFLVRDGSVGLVLSKWDPATKICLHLIVTAGKHYQLANTSDNNKYGTLQELLTTSLELQGYAPVNEKRDHHYASFSMSNYTL